MLQGDKFKRLPSTHYRGGEDIDAGLHSLSIEMEDIPQTTMTADEYLRSGEFGDDDGLDINIPQDDYVSYSFLKINTTKQIIFLCNVIASLEMTCILMLFKNVTATLLLIVPKCKL